MQQQAQINQQSAQAASQARMQELQMEAQIESQKLQMKGQVEVQVAAALHQMKKEIEMIRAQATLGFKAEEQQFREKIEVLKEDRKDGRVEKQAIEQSKLISQRKGERPELQDQIDGQDEIVNQLLNNG